ncbi:hypothetical protein GCM10009555_031770 [Acrocarpospora macrocephala]|uniref:Uncharacterized protein n=1 Tax=Acrocarpospora macrocephala TaxID=150177 RepID=A0A5M3X2I9_9ACTN|nr:hypothetical protein [Acrocarpospora macrocephala]GES12508.1 hypothetical protein Amac_061050 [Acrocarpospora macrocephala]
MPVEWSRQEVLDALGTHLLRPRAATDDYTVIDVITEPDNLLVIFRWRRDPNTYAVEVEFPASPESSVTGEPLASVDEWAADVAFSIAEQLWTGLVRRSRRTIRDGYVVLDIRDAPDVCPAGFFISSVPLVILSSRPQSPIEPLPPPALQAGHWLAEAGMDVTIPQRSLADAKLACWLQAYVNNAQGEPYVGHAAASWEDDDHTTARLDLARTQPGIPPTVREALVRLAICEVAEAGALHMVTMIDIPELHTLGFRPTPNGELTLATSCAGP